MKLFNRDTILSIVGWIHCKINSFCSATFLKPHSMNDKVFSICEVSEIITYILYNNLLCTIISISKYPLPSQLNIYTQLFSSNHKQHDKMSFFNATFYHHPDHHIFLIELTSHKNPNWVAVCCAKPDTRCTYVEGTIYHNVARLIRV